MPVRALGAPHTTSTTPRAGVDLADLQLVGVGMLLGLDHAGDGEGPSFAAGSSTPSTSSPIDASFAVSSATDAEVSR